MKNLTLRASAIALALAAGTAVGCSSGGCGGTNLNSNNSSSSSTPSMQCGNGTYLNSAHQCVPMPTTSAAPATSTNYLAH
jgi:hypothetical protein